MMITFISADSLGLLTGPNCDPGTPGVGTTFPHSYSFAGAGAAATLSFLYMFMTTA